MERLAENLQRINEDDLLFVVQMIHDNKTDDSWTKNDVERASWHFEPPVSLIANLIQKANFK